MEVQNYKCDICGAMAESGDYYEPYGWVKISYRPPPIQSDNENVDDCSVFWHKTKDICPECAKPIIDILKVWHE